jgi:anthranilate phosphoribosyltransferase
MNDELSDILGADPREHAELAGVAHMLEASRPVPRPAYRGELGRRLRGQPYPGTLKRLRLRALSLGTAGALLLAVAGLGVAHHGPLAPSRVASAPVLASSR